MKYRFRTATALLAALAILFAGCSAAPAKPLVGTWIIEDERAGLYGAAVRFYPDGAVSFGLEGTDTMSIDQVESVLDSIKSLIKLTYSVEDNGRLKITASAVMGAAEKSVLIDYSLSGDTLTLGDTRYTRAGT